MHIFLKFFLYFNIKSEKWVDFIYIILYNINEVREMKLFQMSIVDTPDFNLAVTKCQMAFGIIVARKRTRIWIATFEEGDDLIVRETLEEIGSKYKGKWRI